MCVCVRVCVCARARACVCNVPTWSARTADNCFSWKGKSTTARSLSKRACGLTSSNLYASVCVCMDHIQTCMHASHVCMRACTLMPVGADTHTHTHTHTHTYTHVHACLMHMCMHAFIHSNAYPTRTRQLSTGSARTAGFLGGGCSLKIHPPGPQASPS